LSYFNIRNNPYQGASSSPGLASGGSVTGSNVTKVIKKTEKSKYFVIPIVIWDYVRGELVVTFNEQTWRILKNLA
jgi:hypothetical protein